MIAEPLPTPSDQAERFGALVSPRAYLPEGDEKCDCASKPLHLALFGTITAAINDPAGSEGIALRTPQQRSAAAVAVPYIYTRSGLFAPLFNARLPSAQAAPVEDAARRAGPLAALLGAAGQLGATQDLLLIAGGLGLAYFAFGD